MSARRQFVGAATSILVGLLAMNSAQAASSQTRWSNLVCVTREDIPRTFPDTQACYLSKEIEARSDVAYKVDFDLPYATYTSTTTYADDKVFAYITDSQYVVRDSSGVRVPNPYQPGNVVMTPRSQRKVTLYVTPNYTNCVNVQHKGNCLATNSSPTFAPRNLIFQRVYYANRTDPETGDAFNADDKYDRLGYTDPGAITCVNPLSLDQAVDCPNFPLFRDLPNLDLDLGHSTPPRLQASHPECPHRQRWDRPQSFWTHWAGPGASVMPSGDGAPNVATSCTGYLVSVVYDLLINASGNRRTEPANLVVMTYIRTPPTFFDVITLKSGTSMPDPDIRYVGIQNYGAAGSDVVYNEQSRAVGEIPVFTQGKGANATKSWVFVHYSRPVLDKDAKTIRRWGEKNRVSVQQLAYFDPALNIEVTPPFMIYRQKEPSAAYQSSPGSVTGSVPCYPWQPDPPNGPTQDLLNSPLQNASSATMSDGVTIMQDGFTPITITCEYTPGDLKQKDLDTCLGKLLATNPSWFKPDGRTTCDPDL
jgi:hypothetical protein